jgi:hypothetical protein
MQSYIKKISYLSIILSPAILAKVYTLNKNETVSELLYNRLKISPIYRNGYLQKVLDFNHLSPKASKSLPIGTKIQLPPAIKEITKEVTSELNIPSPKHTEPEVLRATNTSFYFGVRPTVEIIKGDIKPSEITSTFFYPHTHIGFSYESMNFIHTLEGSMSYVSFKRDQYLEGDNNFLNGGLFYQILKKQKNVNCGVKLNAENSMLVISSENHSNYSMKNPFIISIGPSAQWQSAKFSNEVNFLYSPFQQFDTNNDLQGSLGAQGSSYRPLGDNTQIGVVGAYSHNKLEDTVIHKASVGISIRWKL